MIKFLLPGLLSLTLYVKAQEPGDALRYSRITNSSGTSRTIALGGALTGLGGDLSAASINPAGIALFKTNEIVLSPGLTMSSPRAEYLGQSQSANKQSFNFGTSGFIGGNLNPYGSGHKNISGGFYVTKLANFNNKISFHGVNSRSSYSEKYLEELVHNNVTDPNKAARDYPFGSSLAINTYLVEPMLDANGNATGYSSMSTPQTGVLQEQDIETSGGITAIGLAFSANIEDKFYYGGTFEVDLLKFKRKQTFTESDASNKVPNNFNYFTVEDLLETDGIGANFKVGVLYKPMEYLRLGLAIHTPMVLGMTDSFSTSITTDLENYRGLGTLSQSSFDLLGQKGVYDYSFFSPWKILGGISYVIREVSDVSKQRGFLTAEVEYLDYGAAKFKDPYLKKDTYLSEVNKVTQTQYKNVINVRAGGELKFNTIMVRAGFGYFSNPYSDPAINGKRINISGGVGYRDKGFFVDLSYEHQFLNDGYYPYRLQDNYFAPVTISGWTGNVMLSAGVKF